MKHRSTRNALRVYLLVQILCLCLTLGGIGAVVAARRTAYTAYGAPAAVQTDTPVSAVVSRLPDKLPTDELAQYASALPAPVGNLFAVFFSFRNILKIRLPDQYDKLHNFFK